MGRSVAGQEHPLWIWGAIKYVVEGDQNHVADLRGVARGSLPYISPLYIRNLPYVLLEDVGCLRPHIIVTPIDFLDPPLLTVYCIIPQSKY